VNGPRDAIQSRIAAGAREDIQIAEGCAGDLGLYDGLGFGPMAPVHFRDDVYIGDTVGG